MADHDFLRAFQNPVSELPSWPYLGAHDEEDTLNDGLPSCSELTLDEYPHKGDLDREHRKTHGMKDDY